MRGTAFDEVSISATADSDVDLTGSAAAATLTATGANGIVLSGAETQTGAEIVNELTSGSLVADIDAAAAVDADEWDVDTIRVSDDMANNTLTVANGANIEVAATQDQMAIDVAGAGTADEVTVTTGANHTTDLTFTGVEVANIAVTSEVTFDNVIIGDKVVLTGSNDVTVTTTDADEFDASGFSGELTLTNGADADINGGTGVNNITLTDNTEVSYVGQSGVDTVDATALTNAASIYALSLGAGDDVVELNGALPAATVVIDGGNGTDTIQVTDGTDTSAATLTLANVEKVELENITLNVDDTGAGATDVTVGGSQVTGTSLEFFTDEADDDANITVTVDGATTDLSGLTLTNIDAVAVNGRNAKDTIVGTEGNDTITASAGAAVLTSGADTLTGGAGDDTFVVQVDDSSATAVLSITDYQAAAAAGDNDTLQLLNTVVVGDAASANVTTLGGAAAAVFADAEGTVNFEVNDGVLTVTGLTSDVALADTLAEWVDIATAVATATATTADSLAFEFSGNTYVLETSAADAVTNLVELTGVTGIEAMGTTAAADTILLG